MSRIATILFVLVAFAALATVAGIAETSHFERQVEAR